jgi:predicted phosphodiesterase
MRFAIIADIHANWEALQAVLEDSHRQKCTHHLCLGDIVGYNANPKECLDLVRSMNIPVVKGNHDEYCSTDEALDGFDPTAVKVVNWVRRQLTPQDRQWLRELEYVRTVNNFTIVHATLDQPQRWGYVFDRLAAAASFANQETAVCFFGHTHVPMVFIQDGAVRGGPFCKLGIEPRKKYFVNVGAVGQPRDNNPKAAYVIYDLEEATIELRRVDYDMGTARQKIIDSGLPPRLPSR